MRGRFAVAALMSPLLACCPHPSFDERTPGIEPLAAPDATRLDGWDYVRDYERYAVFQEVASPPATGGGLTPRQGDYPGVEFDGVMVFLRGFDAWRRRRLDTGESGCGAFDTAGRLCPSVILPGVQLSTAHARELVRLVQHDPGLPRHSCIGSYHHVFVFFNAGRPVRQLASSLRCAQWIVDDVPVPIPIEVYPRLVALCEASGVGMCQIRAEAADGAAAAWRRENGEDLPLGWRRLATKVPRVADKPLDALSSVERRRACVWNTQHVASMLAPAGSWVGLGDAWVRTQTWQACVEQFPSCHATVREMEPCMVRAQRGELIAAQKDPCSAKRECVWGFDVHIGPEPPEQQP